MLLKVIVVLLPEFSIPTEADIRLNVPVLLFSMAATIHGGSACAGARPRGRFRSWNLSDTLKEGGRSGRAAGRHGLRRGSGRS